MEPNEPKPENSQQVKKYLLGVAIIIAGFLLLLTNTGILPYEIKHIFFSWQMLLIAIGIVSLLSNESRTPGTILIAIGGIFLLQKFDLPFNVWHLFWPLILIGIGLMILTKKMPRKIWHGQRPAFQQQHLDDGYINEDHIFSGGKRRIMQQTIRGGQINCIFGGVEIDLTQASLSEGVNELEINTIFGGVTLIIPADWRVQLKMTSIMGGFSDRRAYIRENNDTSKILVVKGSTIFGGGEIKSY